MNKDLKEYIKIINSHREYLRENYSVKSIGIFGSVARGDHKKSSDIDILVELSEPMGFFKFINLEDFLRKILKRKVDLVTKPALKPFIKKNILRETIYA